MTDDPQAMTAGPRTAEGQRLLDGAMAMRPSKAVLPKDIIAIEDAAYAQGVAAARAAVEGLREAVDIALFDAEIGDSHPGCRTKWRRIAMEAFDRAALDSTDRP